MANVTHNAALMDAESGGNEYYSFEDVPELFELPADSIVERFIRHLETTGVYPAPIDYALDSAVKKKDNRFVLATGSLAVTNGEVPFLLMIASGTAARPH
ncbi:MAG: hypothetical protein AB7O69_17260 [Burkholderiales bacterium]